MRCREGPHSSQGSGMAMSVGLSPALRAATAALLLLALALRPAQGDAGAARKAGGGQVAAAQAASAAGRGTAWPRVQTIDGLETLWELPPGPAKGVLFVAHGCNHGGYDFWPPSPRCRHCLGLPQERMVRRAALRRGYALVAVSSFNRTSRCWHNSSPSESEDLQRLPGILQTVIQRESLEAVPLYAFGASSGGGIVLRLAQALPAIRGVVAHVVPARPQLLEVGAGRAYPPVLFVHMAERDPEWAEAVWRTLDYAREAGIPSAEVRIAPQPVTRALLRASPLIDGRLADALVDALRAGGLLDEAGYLLADPREASEQWHAALQPVAGPAGLKLQPAEESHVAQLLAVAWAKHELTGGSTAAALRWLESDGQASIDALLVAQ